MSMRSGSFLGLALSDTSIMCSEVAVSKDRRVIRRTALFTSTDPLFGKTEASGQAFASFLRQHHFRASRAVVGVPARWLLSSEREVPPADEEQTCAVLRLHVERLSASENGEMLFDYVNRFDATRGGKVLLVGILQQQLTRIESLLDSAGIRVAAITPTSFALAAALHESTGQPMLVLGQQGAELVWASDGAPRLLRHVPMGALNGHGPSAMGPLGSELRRTMALTPTNGAGAAREMLLWDGLGISDEQRTELANRTGIALRTGQGIDAMGLSTEAELEDAGRLESFGPAMALALAGARQRTFSLDFKHSRLAPPRHRRFGRKSVWLGVIAASVVLVIGALGWDVHQKTGELAKIDALIEANAPGVKLAKESNDRFNTAQKYFDKRLPVLEFMRDVAVAFREDEPVWATSISLRDTGKGQILGKASDSQAPLALGERLQKNRAAFSNAQTTQVVEMQAAGGRGKEQSFTITFEYKGLE